MCFVRTANVTKPSDKVPYNLIFVSFVICEFQLRNCSEKVKVLFMLHRCQTFSSLPQRKLRFMCWEDPIGLFCLVLYLVFPPPCFGQRKAQWLLKSKHMTVLLIYPKYLSHFSVITNQGTTSKLGTISWSSLTTLQVIPHEKSFLLALFCVTSWVKCLRKGYTLKEQIIHSWLLVCFPPTSAPFFSFSM